jgi:hypothetical protein
VVPPLAHVDDGPAMSPPLLAGDADDARGVVLAPEPPDVAVPPLQVNGDDTRTMVAAVTAAATDARAVTRLVPAVPRLADLITAPLDLVPGDAVVSTVTIDRLDIEIDTPSPRRSPPELIDVRRPAASAPADSGMPSRDLWRGPTDQAFGLGQV